MENEQQFYDGIKAERKNVKMKKKIGKIIIDGYKKAILEKKESFSIEGIESISKKYGVHVYSLNKMLFDKIDFVEKSGNKKGIIFNESDMKAIEMVYAIYMEWKKNANLEYRTRKNIIESTFLYLFSDTKWK